MLSPGFHDDVDESAYHADRTSLSVSGAKVLLKAPALFKWEQEHRPYKAVWDYGHAAHAKVLGVGAEVRVIPDDLLAKNGAVSTGEAKAFIAKARAEGATPLTSKDAAKVDAMADELSGHQLAMSLFAEGKPEVSAYALDELTGVMRRCRYDWLAPDLAVDYKTSPTADPRDFGRTAAAFGYHSQHAWYLDLAHDLGRDLRGFLFVVQSKDAPYLVSVVELTPDAVEVGRLRNRAALERYRDCMESGLWPGYPQTVTSVDIPRWAYYDTQETA